MALEKVPRRSRYINHYTNTKKEGQRWVVRVDAQDQGVGPCSQAWYWQGAFGSDGRGPCCQGDGHRLDASVLGEVGAGHLGGSWQEATGWGEMGPCCHGWHWWGASGLGGGEPWVLLACLQEASAQSEESCSQEWHCSGASVGGEEWPCWS